MHRPECTRNVVESVNIAGNLRTKALKLYPRKKNIQIPPVCTNFGAHLSSPSPQDFGRPGSPEFGRARKVVESVNIASNLKTKALKIAPQKSRQISPSLPQKRGNEDAKPY
jgi:hypothetical protein